MNWEYQYREFDASDTKQFEKGLNLVGGEGWELVMCMMGLKGDPGVDIGGPKPIWICLFKRRQLQLG